MNYLFMDVSTQDVPGELSLTISTTGCQLLCKGCHTPEARDATLGQPLTKEVLRERLERYRGITCVLFFGGDHEPDTLVDLLSMCNQMGYKTALYTGLPSVSELIYNQLHFLKVGPYVAKLGGLNEKTTNQRMFNVKTGEDVTHKFQR